MWFIIRGQYLAQYLYIAADFSFLLGKKTKKQNKTKRNQAKDFFVWYKKKSFCRSLRKSNPTPKPRTCNKQIKGFQTLWDHCGILFKTDTLEYSMPANFVFYTSFWSFIYQWITESKDRQAPPPYPQTFGSRIFVFFNFINKMCIYNVYEPVWHVSLWNKRLYELCPIFLILIKCASTTYMNPFDMFRCEINAFMNYAPFS